MFSLLFVCLSVCLLATLRKNFQTDLHEIFREGWQWTSEQMIKFRWRSGLFSGFVTIGRYGKWSTDCCIESFIHTDSPGAGTDIATLVRRVLVEVCTVPVLLDYLRCYKVALKTRAIRTLLAIKGARYLTK